MSQMDAGAGTDASRVLTESSHIAPRLRARRRVPEPGRERCRDDARTPTIDRQPTTTVFAGGPPLSALHDAGLGLAGLLDSIDDGKLRQVIRLIEASGQRLTLEPALAGLRPRLRKLRPERPLTLPRLLTTPFAAALDHDVGVASSFSIARQRLGYWQARITERLDPALLEAARAAIAGRSEDDTTAMIAAGRRLWPAVASVLAAEPVPDETTPIEAERLRIADLAGIAEQLVPRLASLSSSFCANDADDRATLGAILALATGAGPDRLGTLAAMLLRLARQPTALARRLPDLAPVPLRARLQSILRQLEAEHRQYLAGELARLGGDRSEPLEDAIDRLGKLADALVGQASAPLAEPAAELRALRHEAADLARERYATSIDTVLAPLPAVDAADRAGAIKTREEAARRLARLASIVRRLAPTTAVHELTGATVERLVDLGARCGRGAGTLVDIDDARLIEILAGPDLAWHYLRPQVGKLVAAPGAKGRTARRSTVAGE